MSRSVRYTQRDDDEYSHESEEELGEEEDLYNEEDDGNEEEYTRQRERLSLNGKHKLESRGKLMIPEAAIKKCHSIIRSYQEESYGSMKKWIWGPNVSEGFPFSPPCGYAMIVDKSAPIIPSSFPNKGMFGSTIVLKLNDLVTEREEVTPGRVYLQSRVSDFKARLESSKLAPEESQRPASIRYRDTKQPGSDVLVDGNMWLPSLGSKDSCAGLFWSMESTEECFTENFWIAATINPERISNDLIDLMVQMSEDKKKLSDLYTSEEYVYLKNLATRNANHLLWSLCESLGLKPNDNKKFVERAWDRDSNRVKSSGQSTFFIKPDISVEYNYLADTGSHDYIFYNNCTNALSKCNALPLYRGPYLGYTILQAPSKEDNVDGNFSSMGSFVDSAHSSTIRKRFGMYPINTGRNPNRKRDGVYSGVSSNKINPPPSCNTEIVFERTTSMKQKTVSNKVTKEFYRKRDSDFKSFEEEKLSRNLKWGEENLMPWVVKITSD